MSLFNDFVLSFDFLVLSVEVVLSIEFHPRLWCQLISMHWHLLFFLFWQHVLTKLCLRKKGGRFVSGKDLKGCRDRNKRLTASRNKNIEVRYLFIDGGQTRDYL
jgi:hypothetical protein